jgi:hypothetical protein
MSDFQLFEKIAPAPHPDQEGARAKRWFEFQR